MAPLPPQETNTEQSHEPQAAPPDERLDRPAESVAVSNNPEAELILKMEVCNPQFSFHVICMALIMAGYSSWKG